MATSCYSASDPPNPETPCVPPSYSLRRQQEADLCHYFGNVRVTVDQSSTSSPGSSSYATPTKIQQAQSDFYSRHESGFRNCPRAPMALYSQSIWGGNSVSAGGNFMGSNNLNVHQLIGNPATEQGTRANWSVGATSTSLGSWAHQLSPFGNSDWNQNYGGQNYRGNVERTGLYYFNDNNWAQSSGIPSEIARLAMTQLGSQALVQRMITPGDPLAKSMVLEGVFGSLFEVMCDFHGHYVFRKLVESCNHSRLRLIVAKITLNSEPLINVSVCNYGSKSIQTLIKVLEKSSLIYTLTSALSCVVEELMTNRTGSCVILKCLNQLDIEKNKKIYEAVVRLCVRLAQHERGCIHLNEFITNSKTPYREKLMDKVSSNSKFLSQDPSGVENIGGLGAHVLCLLSWCSSDTSASAAIFPILYASYDKKLLNYKDLIIDSTINCRQNGSLFDVSYMCGLRFNATLLAFECI
ncbi:putative pumilio homolog 8, chloroplastic [Pyrus communis]|uniref:putative pumilio homolog 8, chloroplastic n=1 Tax=Pyrus communis TaxID=23211 RepID=UPI0035C18E1F